MRPQFTGSPAPRALDRPSPGSEMERVAQAKAHPALPSRGQSNSVRPARGVVHRAPAKHERLAATSRRKTLALWAGLELQRRTPRCRRLAKSRRPRGAAQGKEERGVEGHGCLLGHRPVPLLMSCLKPALLMDFSAM